jgi:putative ABC transport system permease protein
MEGFVQDLCAALRALRKSPGFTLTALVTLALGIGANSALFSVVDAVLLRPLPFRQPQELYSVWSRHVSTDRYPFQLPEFCDYRDQSRTLTAVAGLAAWAANLTGDGPAERLTGQRVTSNLYEMMGVQAAAGRTLRPADDTPGKEKVVVLSYGIWQRRFGGDPGVVGRSLALNGEPYEVVGVLPADFLYPTRNVDLAIPLAPEADPWRRNRDTTNFIRILARAREGASQAQIGGDLNAIAERLAKEFPKSYQRKRGVLVVPYREELTRNVSQGLWTLLGAVALVLLIGCANLANLMLVRATERRREVAIRIALGAPRARLLRQLLAESTFLALAGGCLGCLLAFWTVPALVALSPTAMLRANQIAISWPVLVFTLLVSGAAGLSFGLWPALRSGRADPSPDLRAEAYAAGAGREGSRIRGAIVAAQASLMVLLLIGTGLLLRSFREVLLTRAGFDQRVLTARLSLPRKDYGDVAQLSQFYRDVEARLAVLPGVRSVAAVNHVPLNGALASADFKVAERPPASETELPTAQYRMVTPDYFKSMGIPLLEGRAFEDSDRAGGALVAIVSESLARQNFPGKSPLGQHLLVSDTPEGFRSMEIVGVAGDVKHTSLEAEPQPHLYVPYHQIHRQLLVWVTQNQYLVVRASGDPPALAEGLRRAVQAQDPNVAVADVRVTGDYVEAAAGARRFGVVLLSAFAGLALVMAAVGMYGVVSYSVAQRTREAGLRIALGARVPDILLLVVGEGLRRTGLGVGVGLLAAVAANRTVEALLYRVPARDAATYAAAVAVMLGVTFLASLIPAWRAARVDPLVALREG